MALAAGTPEVVAAGAAGTAALRPGGHGARRLAGAATLGLLVALVYHRTLAGLWTTWTTNDNYSHGPLVPLVSLALVATRWRKLHAVPAVGDARGLLLVAAACALQVLGVRADVLTLQGWSILVMLYGLALVFLGGRRTRLLAVPIAYLAFMLTFPPFVMNHLSYALKEATVQAAARAATLLGVSLQRSGMTLWLAGGALEIENPCSGLRSLLAMVAIGALFAWLLPGTWWRRALVLLMAVPMAMAGNALRITALVLVANYVGIHQAVGRFHDLAGYATYALSLAGLLVVWGVLRPPRRRAEPKP